MSQNDSTHKKTALVTGASKRLGAAIIRQLHYDDFNVIIHYRSSAQAAQQLTDELNHQRADSAVCFAADLANHADVNQLAEQTLGYWGRLDTLINNASSFYPTPLSTVTEQNWQQLIDGNVTGAFFLSQALAEALKKSQGCIVNMVDIHAERPLDHHAVYNMAKAAVAMMTKTLAKELAPAVRVNGVSPGAILWPDRDVDEQAKQRILDKIPLQRIGDESDIVRTIRFLMDSPYITGQIIAVDGGRSLTI